MVKRTNNLYSKEAGVSFNTETLKQFPPAIRKKILDTASESAKRAQMMVDNINNAKKRRDDIF